MKLQATTSMNDAIKRLAAGHAGAASVIALLVKEFPEHAMEYMHALDRLEIYGVDIWKTYKDRCDSNVLSFLDVISSAPRP